MDRNRRGISQSTIKQVKEFIDEIYELTVSEFHGTFYKCKKRYRAVITILVHRGILSMKKGFSNDITYRWVAPSAPTKVFYESIAQELIDKERAYAKVYAAKVKSSNTVKEPEQPETASETVVETPVVTPADPLPSISIPNTAWSLSSFSIQELWDEIKRRGCVIHENQLALPTVQYQYFK